MPVEYHIELRDQMLVVTELQIGNQPLIILYFKQSIVILIGKGTVEHEYPLNLG
jgi:hypothetical protein